MGCIEIMSVLWTGVVVVNVFVIMVVYFLSYLTFLKTKKHQPRKKTNSRITSLSTLLNNFQKLLKINPVTHPENLA